MGAQKNRLNEMVLLSTHNICLLSQVRKYSQFYAIFFFLFRSMPEAVMNKLLQKLACAPHEAVYSHNYLICCIFTGLQIRVHN